VLLPSSFAIVYGTVEKIVLEGPVDVIDPDIGPTQISTELVVAFVVDGSTTQPHSICRVPGSILASNALDVVGNTLRSATTVRFDTTWMMSETDAPSNVSTQLGNDMTITENYIIVIEMRGPNDSRKGRWIEEMG
jgi:hypothetical protein